MSKSLFLTMHAKEQKVMNSFTLVITKHAAMADKDATLRKVVQEKNRTEETIIERLHRENLNINQHVDRQQCTKPHSTCSKVKHPNFAATSRVWQQVCIGRLLRKELVSPITEPQAKINLFLHLPSLVEVRTAMLKCFIVVWKDKNSTKLMNYLGGNWFALLVG